MSYLKANFLKRRLPETLEELNFELRKWLDEVVHIKRNQTTQKTPNERFEEERGLLIQWNTKPLYSIQQWETTESHLNTILRERYNPIGMFVNATHTPIALPKKCP